MGIEGRCPGGRLSLLVVDASGLVEYLLGLLRRMLALRHNFSSYDAAYVALAETLGARLLTGDRRLARAAGTHTALNVDAV